MSEYQQTSSGNTAKPLTLIKIGGNPAQDTQLLASLLGEIACMSLERSFVLVHGGGAEVSRIARQFGFTPQFIDGIRQTPEDEMAIIDMGLAGSMNSMILRMALAAGIDAVGLSGIDAGLFTGEPVAKGNRTGRITHVRRRVVDVLLNAGLFPVISSVSSDMTGMGLNINADDAAKALAAELKPQSMLFISDIPGVLDADPSDPGAKRIEELNAAKTEALIDSGVISGGMIPKVQNALELVAAGCEEVIIGTTGASGSSGTNSSLVDLLKHNSGTRFVR